MTRKSNGEHRGTVAITIPIQGTKVGHFELSLKGQCHVNFDLFFSAQNTLQSPT